MLDIEKSDARRANAAREANTSKDFDGLIHCGQPDPAGEIGTVVTGQSAEGEERPVLQEEVALLGKEDRETGERDDPLVHVGFG